jgi:RNA polymerase sigma-70 factor, ECF subfamily
MSDGGTRVMDDLECVAAAISGNVGAFEHLVYRYQRAVYNLAYRMLGNPADAEDATQETFLRAFIKLGSYQPERKFGPWLLSIGSHLCIDRLRQHKVVVMEFQDDFSLIGGLTQGPEQEVMARERQREVRRLLESLPEAYRRIVFLRYWHDLSHNEIAEAVGLPTSTVRMRLFRARKLLASAHARAAEASASMVALAS